MITTDPTKVYWIEQAKPRDPDAYWLDIVKTKIGGNMAPDAFVTLWETTQRNDLSSQQLASLGYALRSLATECRRRVGVIGHREKCPWDFNP